MDGRGVKGNERGVPSSKVSNGSGERLASAVDKHNARDGMQTMPTKEKGLLMSARFHKER